VYNMKRKPFLEFVGHIPYLVGYSAGKVVSAVRFCSFAIRAGYLDAIKNENW